MKKFGAKKIGALAIALALVTVGGVYATWTYTTTSASSASDEIYVSIAGKNEVSSSGGSYSITFDGGSVGKIYTVDQYSYAINQLNNTVDAITNNGATDTGGIYDYVIVTDSNGTTEVIGYGDTVLGNYDNYTVALCISHGATITIDYEITDATASEYAAGNIASFTFSWYSGTAPQVYVDDDSFNSTYNLVSSSASGTLTDVLDLDLETQYIYPTTEAGSAGKVWIGSNGNFEYEMDSTEITKYLTTEAYMIAATATQYGYLSDALSGCQVTLTITDAGTALTIPALSGSAGTPGTLTVSSVTNASGYRIGLFETATEGNPVYSTTSITADADTSVSDILTAMGTVADGTYYVRVRALAGSESYANSEWSVAAYTITIDGSTITLSAL